MPHPNLTRFIILSTLVLVSLTGGNTLAQGPQPQRTAAFQPTECMFEFPISGFLSPAALGFECGYVTVPEQHSRPNGPTLRLAVAILPSTAENPAPDPFFMAQGGPGGSSLELFPLFMLSSSLRDERDIVIFDQRGTLYSEPNLLCPELDDLIIATIELDLSALEAEHRSLAAYQACAERLANEGINLAAFNSLENAADVEAVRIALGYDQINFYGVSYGTLLGLHTMRHYPASLRAVVLDAVVPAQDSFLNQAALSADRAFKEVTHLCAADPNCNGYYPDLENVIYEVMAALNENPATIAVTNPDTQQTYQAVVNGDLFISALFLALYDPSQLPIFPIIVYNTRAGDYTLLSRLLPLLIFQPTFSIGMYQAVICAEEVNFKPEEMPTQGVRPELAALMQDDNEALLDICRLWKIPRLGPEVNTPVVSQVPTLLLSGRFDPITPAHFAEAAAKTLSNSYTYTFPNTSHGAFLLNACANHIVDSFLENPGLPPSAGCIAREPATFDIPTPATLLMTPAMAHVLDLLNGQNLGSLALLLLSLLALLSFVLIWPLAYLIRIIRKVPPSKQTPAVIAWSAPGLVILAGGLGLLFILGLVGLAFSSDLSVLWVGIPKAFAPLFIIPPLLLLLTVAMVIIAGVVWLGGYWSAWRRVYYSLLTLAAVIFVGVLVQWDMLTVLL